MKVRLVLAESWWCERNEIEIGEICEVINIWNNNNNDSFYDLRGKPNSCFTNRFEIVEEIDNSPPDYLFQREDDV